MKVLVLMGGDSTEREISLKSGQGVAAALQKKGYDVTTLDVNKDAVASIRTINPDVVFIALHGKKGEDGTIQGLLEIMDIPYTGPGIACSAVCMNKVLTKKMLKAEGIPTAPFVILRKQEFSDSVKVESELINTLGLPMVVKASTQGSSIGTYIVKKSTAVLEAVTKAFSYDEEVIVEKFIDGMELTASVIGNKEPQVLPLIEIVAGNEFYDYEAKYTPGKCNHIIPARISNELSEKIARLAERTYIAMGCRGFSRIDFMVDKEENPFVLEVNTIPGMTEMSLVPDAARAAGISFEELVAKIVGFALEDNN